jgi:hypothetical protein
VKDLGISRISKYSAALGRRQKQILRYAALRSLQKIDELLVSVEQFRPSGPEGVLPAFCTPRTSSALVKTGGRLVKHAH